MSALTSFFQILFFFRKNHRDMAGSLQNAVGSALGSGLNALQCGAGANIALGNVQIRYVHSEIVLSVRTCAFDQLDQILAGALDVYKRQ